ncbi:MAG: DUF2851 family protein [Sphingobacteriales bacterium]|nr:DUF2851 family protein [Sphingobacteriales bacterium]
MREQLLHYIWQHKLFNTSELKTTLGSELQIVDFGKYNTDGGPDFWNAKIRIDDVVLAGTIELHVHASDWNLHSHQDDRKYDNVILHVVYFNDVQIQRLPTLELNGRIPMILLDRYKAMMQSHQTLICGDSINSIDDFVLENWKERLIIERLERKSEDILLNLSANGSDWEQTCYQLLGKYFGSHINKEQFEQLTRLLDYKLLMKHKAHSFQMEALLFGVAGFLNKDFVEIYPRDLKEEYLFLKHKYGLKQMSEHQWQFLRIRPVSFPTIRLAWFAQFIQQMPLLHKIIEEDFFDSMAETIAVSEYWDTHYVFDKMSKLKSKKMGHDFKAVLQINVFIPLLYAYGKYIIGKVYRKAIDLLRQIPAEQNSKTAVFEAAQLASHYASDSQAYMELFDNYCARKRCLHCAIGHKILSNTGSKIYANNV